MEDAIKHLGEIFNPNDIIEIRCFNKNDGDKPRVFWMTVEEMPEYFEELRALNEANYNIHYGANPRKYHGGKTAADVAIANAITIDMDHGCQPQTLLERVKAAGLPEPTIVVFTGGGSQAQWRLEAPIPIDRWLRIQRGVAACAEGTDGSINDAPHVMRLAGFRNMKPEREGLPFVTIEVLNSGSRHSPDAFPEAKELPAAPIGEPAFELRPGRLSDQAEAFLERGELYRTDGEPSRNRSAFCVACDAKARGIPIEEITSRIMERCREGHESWHSGPLDEPGLRDLERQIRSAYSEPRTPGLRADETATILAQNLSDKPEFTIEWVSKDEARVVVERGEKTHVDTFRIEKASARKKFIVKAREIFGAEADLGKLEEDLLLAAAGKKPESLVAEASVPETSEIEGGRVVRPERFLISDGGHTAIGFSYPHLGKDADGEVQMSWKTIIFRLPERTREVTNTPTEITVGENTYFLVPVPQPPEMGAKVGWSKASREQWLAGGRDEISPVQLFRELEDAIEEFVDLPPEVRAGTRKTLALFVFLTYSAPVFPAVPYISVNGTLGSGKSRVLDILGEVVFRPIVSSSTTVAVIFRALDNAGGTVLFDEAEQLKHAEKGMVGDLYPILLAGYRRCGAASRCEGEENKIKSFSCFGPKALASINELPETLASRCIQIVMFRAPKGSPKALHNPQAPESAGMWQRLRDSLHVISLNYGAEILSMPERSAVVPTTMMPRSAEIWGPLLYFAAWLEEQGVTGLLGEMQEFAVSRATVAEEVGVPELDLAVLKAYAGLAARALNKVEGADFPQAKEICTKLVNDPEFKNTSPTAKAVGTVLKQYQIRSTKVHGVRRFRVTEEQIRQIESNYGIEIMPTTGGGYEINPTYPNVPHVPPEAGVGVHGVHGVRVPEGPTEENNSVQLGRVEL